jgi:hypothetical protein
LVFQLYVGQYGLVEIWAFIAGHSWSCPLDSTLGFPTPGGSAGIYGYWIQPIVDGLSGLLFPAYWLAAQ